ncbi:hypothetical protein AWB76_06891 [Caballeronia temeraria]|uniref:Uncharacterized protein n=1 Tax=Caballeronia temeraria TaxID=1777137 RepID=A0A158DF39_9BURK|nr:hypothetical protein AWB76_06891 [Caballeronia temeraria]
MPASARSLSLSSAVRTRQELKGKGPSHRARKNLHRRGRETVELADKDPPAACSRPRRAATPGTLRIAPDLQRKNLRAVDSLSRLSYRRAVPITALPPEKASPPPSRSDPRHKATFKCRRARPRRNLDEVEQAMQSVTFSAERVDLGLFAAFDDLSFVERAIPDDSNRGEAGRFTHAVATANPSQKACQCPM